MRKWSDADGLRDNHTIKKDNNPKQWTDEGSPANGSDDQKGLQ